MNAKQIQNQSQSAPTSGTQIKEESLRRMWPLVVTSKGHLTQHQKEIHGGEIKYLCRDWDYLATKNTILTQHQQEVHTVKNYQCRECENQATKKSSLTQQ